ncbi:MAG TPA: sigma-54 dependent transcriptional regulator [bacterium]|nr:sigma-54 dependent transcriptional regulator [bacterium]
MVNDDKPRLLVVDDVPEILEALQRKLAARGYAVFTAPGAPEAIKLLDETAVDLVITDMKMPRVSGLELIRYVRENLPDTEVMMITAYASVPDAVEAVKTGAEEYLAKPFTDEELLTAVSRILEKLRARRMTERLPRPGDLSRYGLVAESKVMHKVFQDVEKAAATNATVLITGESGTGKELVARATHYASDRAAAPFVPVNCGAVPQELLESELFGHVKGAFTGARDTRAGFFQTADGGTIFLDEIAETNLSMQVKLLRVLQDKNVYMVGSRRPHKADVRIIAASNKDLLHLVNKGAFRDDLYYRLAVITIDIPPLRERGDDILLLTNVFVDKYSGELGKTPLRLSDKVIQVFREYNWPGNVRELENVIQRLVAMTDAEEIDVPDLPSLMRHRTVREVNLTRPLEEVEVEYIQNVLASVGGNKTEAAEVLGINRKTLAQKLKKSEGYGDST